MHGSELRAGRASFRLGLLLFCVVLTAACNGRERAVGVCELFRNVERFEGKVIEVRGLATIERDPIAFGFLSPIPPESCRYRNTQEPAEIDLQYPGEELRLTPPKGYRWDPNAVDRALRDLEVILKSNPNVNKVAVTARGILTIRQYDVPEKLPEGYVPRDLPFPGTLEIESLSDVQYLSK